ncbi:unnamed protein product [Urochloa humidicola]
MLSPRPGAPPPCPRAHSPNALAQLHTALAKSGLSTCSATPATAAAAARACARLRHIRAGRAVHGASAKLALLSASTLVPNALLHLYVCRLPRSTTSSSPASSSTPLESTRSVAALGPLLPYRGIVL